MAYLYISPKGVAWRKHSYSAGLDFDRCPLMYKLRRVDGWKPKDNKAAFAFGRCVEESVQYYHDNNGTRAIETFIAKWGAFKDDKELKYTKTERDWENLKRCGVDMMRLYMLMQPSLPIPIGGQAMFQREYSKEVYPGDPNYGEIEDAGKLDIVCLVDPNHPMLTPMEWRSQYGALRPLIVDMKTGGKKFHEAQGMARFDPQLRRYAWLSGILDVAFLWFKKSGTTLKKGCLVTLLEEVGSYRAGQEMYVAYEGDEDVFIVPTQYQITEMDAAQGRKKDGKLDTTKEATARKFEWLAVNSTAVPPSSITRCRLQFNSARLTPAEAEIAGRQAGRQIQGIVNAYKTDTWDNTFGVRFPHDDSNDPYFIAFVLNDEAYRKQNFTKSDDSALDELFADDYDSEDSDE